MAPEEGAPGHEEGQGEEAFIPNLPRTRGHVGSGASSIASGPRRSARLTSSSESSSVEPPDRPLTRLRRREPYIRNVSEDAVLVNGGITRRTTDQQYVKAFAQAGFEAISWKHDRRRIAKEFAPLTQLARDIPHDLHDRLNALSLGVRRAGNMQVLVFEAEIRANTAEDEPGAPPIRVVNDVDDEPTPPLEFYYSNLMWHGAGVPGPDLENLQGCDCVGPCDPTSRTCACVRRQQKWWPGGPAGFIYDKKGRLRELGYPIFECNMNCGCSDDCQNRVVQNGRQHEIAICKTPNKGWGVFAGPKKIPANSYLGTYAGEFLTSWECEERGKVYNKFGRTYLFDLDFWYLDQPEVKKEDYSVDAYHAGNFTRYLNHSCDPNCVINACYINEANLDKPLLTIFTCRDVEPFEELCFSYFGEPDDDTGVEVPKEVKDNDAVYVSCQCGAANCRGTMWK
ncbi:SET domain-containing protein [Trametes elegans]|nr:SET domain-containing protein [Trametes elegans]